MSSSDRSNRPHTGMAGIFPEDALGPKGTPLSVEELIENAASEEDQIAWGSRPTIDGVRDRTNPPVDRPVVTRGMLLLDPDYNGGPVIWTATSDRHLVAYRGSLMHEATLQKPGVLPDGWRLLENRPTARLIEEGTRPMRGAAR